MSWSRQTEVNVAIPSALRKPPTFVAENVIFFLPGHPVRDSPMPETSFARLWLGHSHVQNVRRRHPIWNDASLVIDCAPPA
jgi:hypothetical protein